MGLLFINALKGLRRKKVQMLGIILMVLLSTGIYVTMNTAIDRLEDRYYNYLDSQNVEDFAFDVVIDLEKDISLEDLEQYRLNQLQNLTETEKKIIDLYQYSLMTGQSLDTQTSYYIKSILKKYEVDILIGNQKLDKIKDEYDFTYEVERSKTVFDKDTMIKVIPYEKDTIINKTYLVDGDFPTNDNEITILPDYAKENDLKIGDTYKIGEKEYKIVGFTYAPDYIYPMIDISNPIFDESKNNIVFMSENDYKVVSGVNDNTYSLVFNYDYERTFEMSDSDNEDPMMKLFDEESDTIAMSQNTVIRMARISALQLEFGVTRKFADYFLYLLLGVSVFIITVITKKRIDDERLQIGVLKSLGYNRLSIACSYLVYPIIGSLIGGALGYLLGIITHYPITELYRSYYTIPLDNFNFDFSYLLTSLLLPTIFLSIISYLIAIFMLRKKPLQLLKEGSNLKVNLLSKLVNKITKPLPFDYRFKYSLASRSLGKLLVVSLTSFCTGLLIVLTLIGMNLFNNMIDTSFEGMKYDYMVILNQTNNQEKEENSDLILSQSLDLKEIKGVDGNTLEVEDRTISLSGMDADLNYFEILNEDKEDISDKLLDEDGIIISQTLKEVLEVDIGDILVFEIDNQKVEYQVIDVCEEYMSLSGYVNRNGLSKKLGLEEFSYNQFATTDKKYQSIDNLSDEQLDNISRIVSITDLKENIANQMEQMNGSIYIVIAFASVMALIIIAVIANIVVEENKRTISLMKVMGYNNKKISRIVLNIYTPFVIIAYLLSIPCMISLLKWIISLLVGDMDMVIPVTFSPVMALIGLIGLVFAYYLAIAISRRVLNKVPLAVALKRE